MTPFEDNFGEDPFENLVRDFFGGRRRVNGNSNKFIDNENDERETDYVDDGEYAYLIFELPGFNEEDISVVVSGKELHITVGKKENICEEENVQGYLINKLCREVVIKKNLPKFINSKNFKHSMRNGILEIMFSNK